MLLFKKPQLLSTRPSNLLTMLLRKQFKLKMLQSIKPNKSLIMSLKRQGSSRTQQLRQLKLSEVILPTKPLLLVMLFLKLLMLQ